VWSLADDCSAINAIIHRPISQSASYQSIPGHPRWMMAPIEMAWQGKSIGEMCRPAASAFG
jgi:hypothetical protein